MLIILARNITDPKKVELSRPDGTADYDVEVSVNREKMIWTGKIENFERRFGASTLLRRIADEIDKAEA